MIRLKKILLVSPFCEKKKKRRQGQKCHTSRDSTHESLRVSASDQDVWRHSDSPLLLEQILTYVDLLKQAFANQGKIFPLSDKDLETGKQFYFMLAAAVGD